MASRSLEALLVTSDLNMPRLARDHIACAARVGIELLVYCTFRSPEEQARLWRQGRDDLTISRQIVKLRSRQGTAWVGDLIEQVGRQPGARIVTNALPGSSAHNYGLAYDAVPILHGKPAWNDGRLLAMMGEIGEQVGLEWAGRWQRFRETVHFQALNWRQYIKEAQP